MAYASLEAKSPLKVNFREQWKGLHWVSVILGILLISFALETVLTDEGFKSAEQEDNNCTALEEYSPNCELAEDNWNDEIGYVWSMATLGMLMIGGSGLEFSRGQTDINEDE